MWAKVAALFAFAVTAKASFNPCGVACNKVTKALTCTAGCKGLDAGICKTGKYAMCEAGCLGIHECKKKCEHAIVKPCIKKLVDECNNKCVDHVVKPCQESCDKEGFKVCLKVMEKAGEWIGNRTIGTEVCADMCTEAAVDADLAGAGPEDPFADAVAAAIEATCNPVCQRAVKQFVLKPASDAFGAFVCKEIGFKKPGLELASTITV